MNWLSFLFLAEKILLKTCVFSMTFSICFLLFKEIHPTSERTVQQVISVLLGAESEAYYVK